MEAEGKDQMTGRENASINGMNGICFFNNYENKQHSKCIECGKRFHDDQGFNIKSDCEFCSHECAGKHGRKEFKKNVEKYGRVVR